MIYTCNALNCFIFLIGILYVGVVTVIKNYKLALKMATFLLFAVFLLFVSCDAKDFSFTFRIGAGTEDCFHETFKEGMSFEVEYQVGIK